MKSFLKILATVLVMTGLFISLCKVGSFFLPETSDISILGEELGSTGLIFILVGQVLLYQMKVAELQKQLREIQK